MDGEGFADPANAGPHARSPPSRPEALPAGVAGCSGAFVDGGFRTPPSGAIGDGAAGCEDAGAIDARVVDAVEGVACPRRLRLGAGSRVLASLIGRGEVGRAWASARCGEGVGEGTGEGELS